MAIIDKIYTFYIQHRRTMTTSGLSRYLQIGLAKHLRELDVQDGTTDGKIHSDQWNPFAEEMGLYHIRDGKKIRVSRAEEELGKMLEGKNDLSLAAKQEAFLQGAKVAINKGYVIGGQMLRISLDDEALTFGYHSDGEYTVIPPEDGVSKLEELGMPFGTKHNIPQNARLKAVVFDENSKVAKGASNSRFVIDAIKKWVDKGAVFTKPITLNTFDTTKWKNADDMDLGLGLGNCCLIGLKYDGNYVTGYIEDVYDYDEDYGGTKLPIVDMGVGVACELQDGYRLKKYRSLTPIKVYVGAQNKRTQNQRTKEQTWSDKIAKGMTTEQKSSIPQPLRTIGRKLVDGIQSGWKKLTE